MRARHGDPWVEELQPARDGRALHALGAWCMAKVSPVVALDPPDGLFMDVAGTGRLLGDEEDVCRALLRAMHRFGLGARLAVADTVGAAWALSHFGRTPRQLVETGDEEAVLAPLPVESLRLEPATTEGLAELGVRSVGELVRLDRARVAARFGGDVALRLDQALGRAFEAVTPLVHETPPQRERTFEGPVKALEGILETAESLVGELAAELLRARRGALELVLVLEPSDLPPRSIPLTLARPSASGRHLWTMLEPKVAGAHLGFGIERVRVSAVRTGRLPSRQTGAWGAEDKHGAGLDRDMGELVDVLRARLGEERVLTPAPRRSHLPERAYGWERPGQGSARRAPEASPAAPLPPPLAPVRPARARGARRPGRARRASQAALARHRLPRPPRPRPRAHRPPLVGGRRAHPARLLPPRDGLRPDPLGLPRAPRRPRLRPGRVDLIPGGPARGPRTHSRRPRVRSTREDPPVPGGLDRFLLDRPPDTMCARWTTPTSSAAASPRR